jgi:ribonuclease HII
MAQNKALVSEKTVKELKRYFRELHRSATDAELMELEKDSRIAARQLAGALRKRRLEVQIENKRLVHLLQFESELWRQGFRFIAGVDEAGMAPLAGPVLAAAVILPHRYKLVGLNDSKKILNERKRQQLATQIKRDAVCWAIGRADVDEIDRINIYQSGLLAMRRAIEGLSTPPEYILVDARTIPHCALPQRGIIHGDSLSASIAAASIIAKTTRDVHMDEMDKLYPGYGFASHKGYPTPDHVRILKERGPLPIHRRTFGPVRSLLASPPLQKELFL